MNYDRMRDFENRVVEVMIEDGWGDVPVTGETMLTAFNKILAYIDFLRDGRRVIQTETGVSGR